MSDTTATARKSPMMTFTYRHASSLSPPATMKILRTPDNCFANLVDYPFAPHYHAITPSLRLHYVDEGPRTGAPVLLMHGEPTWSYLYRHMIPPLARAGYRVLAPDLVGFGKSDKPARKSDHSYAQQVAWIRHWVEGLDLQRIDG